MFIIGTIVGIILGAILMWLFVTRLLLKMHGISLEEARDLGNLMIDAAQNRECEVMLVKNDEAIEVVEFLNE